MKFISQDSPELLNNTSLESLNISFDGSSGFVNSNAGDTAPWSLKIRLARAYTSKKIFIGTVAHELGHRASGTWGIIRTNFEDNYIPNDIGYGSMHERTHLKAQEIKARYGE